MNTIVVRYCSIAPSVRRMGINHPANRFTTSTISYSTNGSMIQDYTSRYSNHLNFSPLDTDEEGPIIIGNDVWIGEGTLFSSKGMKVHDGAIVNVESIVI